MSTDDCQWYRNRRYLHFDHPIGVKAARELVTNPLRVQSHSFYPLITYELDSVKIFKDRASGLIDKKIKKRPIMYAAHADSHIYSYYADLLSKEYEAALLASGLSGNILAFRPLGKSNIDFAAQAFNDIRLMGNCAAVALDVTAFFDNLDHEILKDAWCGLIGEPRLPPDHYAVYKAITKFSKVSKLEVYDKLGISTHNPKNNRTRICEPAEFRNVVRAGGLISANTDSFAIPQGSPISALLSNIYMFAFDEWSADLAASLGGEYYRYCDDILFIVPVSEKDRVANKARKKIRRLELEINKEKVEIRTFKVIKGRQASDKPLQYLGFTYDGERILIRSAALARYSEKMKRGVKFAKATMRKRNRLRDARGEPTKPLYRKNLYRLYSHTGRRNFLRYGYRAAEKMNSPAIRKQLKPLWERLQEEIER
ncbi:antiviral reverse transcriptase Drt2 [Parahaliea mediterranea]|uniref:Group II intron reverse transcriptase domain-containing protein n=1 Tax=Parahaliea mediterranea TaxID=651086 RepID=A0A939DEF7_9GAMM|nr:antiviral reverse transcriptase Drt2 [Parahaliea mediterranea]MBN7796648.1 group II intron reverse transcriptase domain-containing protein [Parahaliea mediterranea]